MLEQLIHYFGNMISKLPIVLLVVGIVFVIRFAIGSLNKDRENTKEVVVPLDNKMGMTMRLPDYEFHVLDRYGNTVQKRPILCSASRGFYIGRSSLCDVVIPNEFVGSKHAIIGKDAHGYYLKDLKSTNGTWINKQRIKTVNLEEDLYLEIANTPCRIARLYPHKAVDDLFARLKNSEITSVERSGDGGVAVGDGGVAVGDGGNRPGDGGRDRTSTIEVRL